MTRAGVVMSRVVLHRDARRIEAALVMNVVVLLMYVEVLMIEKRDERKVV